MNSFYGGKQGRTYNIVQRYDAVYLDINNYPNKPQILYNGDIYKEKDINNNYNFYLVLDADTEEIYTLKGMCNEFSKGDSYTDVNYGEYVLIDTVLISGRSSDENGLLFRRGFDYNEGAKRKPLRTDSDYNPNNNFDKNAYQAAWKNWVTNVGCGAEYVGQIVGPEGRTPEVTIEDWNTFDSQIANSTGFGGKSSIIMNSPGIIKNGEGAEIPYTYNDEVNAGYINLIDANGDITGGYISFDIPTSIFNFTAQSVDPYGQETLQKYNIEETFSSNYKIGSTYDSENNKWKYDNLIYEQPKSADHPFFHNFDIAIPNGIHGQNIEEIKIETGLDIQYTKTTDTQIDDNKDYYIKNGDIYSLVEQPNVENIKNYYEYTPSQTTVENNDEYFTYSVKNFDASADGAVTEHLGIWPYRVIDHIWQISNSRDLFNNEKLPYPTQSVQIGQLIKLNDNKYAICIKEGTTGTELPEDFQNPEIKKEITDGTVIWRVIQLSQTAAAGYLDVIYKAGIKDQIDFKQIDNIFIDNVGQMYVVYSNDLTTPHPIGQVDSIAKIDHPQNGQIAITHKNGTVDNFGIREIDRIDLPQDITQDQDITAYYKEYNNSTETVTTLSSTVGSLNDILDIQRLGDNILILYSDPRVRAAIPQGSTYAQNWTDWRTGQTYNDLVWYNFGQLGAQYHVDGTHSYDEIDLSTNPPGNLGNGFGYTWDTQSSTYVPNNQQDKMGWIITIPTYEQGDNSTVKPIQKVYAYKYQADSPHELVYYDDQLQASTITTKWYEVTSLADAITPPDSHMVVSEEDSEGSIYHTRENLKPDGVWFVVSEGGCNHA